MPQPRRLFFRGVPFICTHNRGGFCGRVIYTNDPKVLTWLIGPRVDNPAKVIVRCPQHITERTLRMAGRRRTRRMYKWARLARESDDPMSGVLPPGAIIEVDPVVLINAYFASKQQRKEANAARVRALHAGLKRMRTNGGQKSVAATPHAQPLLGTGRDEHGRGDH